MACDKVRVVFKLLPKYELKTSASVIGNQSEGLRVADDGVHSFQSSHLQI